MKINPVNITFCGTWQKTVSKTSCQSQLEGYRQPVSDLFVVDKKYRPCKDEVIPPEIKKLNGQITGKTYLEINSNTNVFNRSRSATIEKISIGENLNLTLDEYNKLVEIKRQGEEAAKKLEELGTQQNTFECLYDNSVSAITAPITLTKEETSILLEQNKK